MHIDGVLEVVWHGRGQPYIFEYKSRSTPQAIEMALTHLRRDTDESGLPPLLITPYLSEEQLSSLEQQGISAVDLSGNGVILGSGFTIWRSGKPNCYPASQSIRNIYRGDSSLIARCFLLRAEFASLKSLREYAVARLFSFDGAGDVVHTSVRNKLTIGTASKVVRQLEEELIIRKTEWGLQVVDGNRLLENLRTNYRSDSGGRVEGKTALSAAQIWERLASKQTSLEEIRADSRYVATGLGSATEYRALSSSAKLSLYVGDLGAVAELLELRATRVFPNIELIEDKNNLVYFDARRNGKETWASPIQAWLELATGGPREREAAQTLETILAQGRGEEMR
jgi:hypothetical protein